MVLVKAQETVRFIAKFEDYADSQHPFMYHCHIALHEDEGMMGQFVVTDNGSGLQENNAESLDFNVVPNPAHGKIFLYSNQELPKPYYVKILNAVGKTVRMLPQPDITQGISIEGLASGVYYLIFTEPKTKVETTRKFIVE